MQIEKMAPDIQNLEKSLALDVESLLAHPLYSELLSLDSIQIFMTSHVFAVWDFMSLLKSLQNRITCVQVPWSPRVDSDSVRFINEIVLAEESDEIAPGQFLSHYQLYLKAMSEVGADSKPIQKFVSLISTGTTFDDAMKNVSVPASTKDFVWFSLEISRAPLHITAASFFYGREDIIPKMFQRILGEIESQAGMRCEALRLYLNRHIEVDQNSHGPLAKKLLTKLCQNNPALWQDALNAARLSIKMRQRLWDGVLDQLKKPLHLKAGTN